MITPLPWKRRPNRDFPDMSDIVSEQDAPWGSIYVADQIDNDDADLIVRAVNEHDVLVRTLRDMLNRHGTNLPDDQAPIHIVNARNVLKLASEGLTEGQCPSVSEPLR